MSILERIGRTVVTAERVKWEGRYLEHDLGVIDGREHIIYAGGAASPDDFSHRKGHIYISSPRYASDRAIRHRLLEGPCRVGRTRSRAG